MYIYIYIHIDIYGIGRFVMFFHHVRNISLYLAAPIITNHIF